MCTAQWHADRAARRPKISKLAKNSALRDYVQDRLAGLIATPEGIEFDGPVVVWKKRRAVHRQSRRWSSAWSPEQIVQRLKVGFPEDPTMRISHETIYQALYIQGRGVLKREFSACLLWTGTASASGTSQKPKQALHLKCAYDQRSSC
ncbi:hypothetical protein HKD21_13665 [Gluconobacter cerevisiae]|uniref:Transposase n=1 Tax=Gluconobacter cerevisiae TaxID=1379734 RepID=A0ABR9YH88_9PROT|nr:hypothetical protein [Gluconobacter cerevisiae]